MPPYSLSFCNEWLCFNLAVLLQSGGLAHKSTGAFSPLRGSVDSHAASFSSGQKSPSQGQGQGQGQQNQNYNTSNAAGQLQQHMPDQGSPVKGSHHHHHSHHTSHAGDRDHQGGPGHNGAPNMNSSDGRYGSPARATTTTYAPHSPTATATSTSGQFSQLQLQSPSAQTSFAYVGSGGTSAGGSAAASGRRSASASRGNQQTPTATYSLASPPGYTSGTNSGASSPKVEYYEHGRSGGEREGGRLRFASMPQDAPSPSQTLERYQQQRPITSGGRTTSPLATANHAALSAAYQVKQSSTGAGAGSGSGSQRMQNFASFDASSGSTGYNLQNNAMVARPRTSGGFLPSTSNGNSSSGGGGGQGQGRSASNGRSGSSYRKRF